MNNSNNDTLIVTLALVVTLPLIAWGLYFLFVAANVDCYEAFSNPSLVEACMKQAVRLSDWGISGY